MPKPKKWWACHWVDLFDILPCRPGQKIPQIKRCKKIRTKDGIEKWWEIIDPNSDIAGFPKKDSGLVIVDCDVKNGAMGVDTVTGLLGGLPQTYTVQTPSGGLHLWFWSIDGLDIRSGNDVIPAAGIDVRADDGKFMVMLPGSLGYEVVNDTQIAKMPQELAEVLAYEEEHWEQENEPWQPSGMQEATLRDAIRDLPAVIGQVHTRHEEARRLLLRARHQGTSEQGLQALGQEILLRMLRKADDPFSQEEMDGLVRWVASKVR